MTWQLLAWASSRVLLLAAAFIAGRPELLWLTLGWSACEGLYWPAMLELKRRRRVDRLVARSEANVEQMKGHLTRAEANVRKLEQLKVWLAQRRTAPKKREEKKPWAH